MRISPKIRRHNEDLLAWLAMRDLVRFIEAPRTAILFDIELGHTRLWFQRTQRQWWQCRSLDPVVHHPSLPHVLREALRAAGGLVSVVLLSQLQPTL